MDKQPAKILITGDFCPINRIEELALKGDFQSILNDFIDVFRGNDLNIVNLECPLTRSDNARPKSGPHQKASPETIDILKYADVSLAVMANNHIMDYGNKGVKDTLDTCEKAGIDTAGIGRSVAEAGKPYSVEIKGKKIAFLNFADNEFLSTPDNTYTCKPLDPVKCTYDIKNAKKEHDYVFVIVHAGNEFYELPSPRTKELYRYFIDQGADVVVAHHTHAFSGYEMYNNKLIFYGLGNFIFDWPGKINDRWNMGYVVRFSVSDKIYFEIIPLKQGNEEPGVFHLNNDEEAGFKEEIERLNGIIIDDEKLEKEFHNYCEKVYPMYDAFIEPYFGKYITALRKRGLFPKLLSRRKRILLLNIIRCESHRDVLLRMLKRYK